MRKNTGRPKLRLRYSFGAGSRVLTVHLRNPSAETMDEVVVHFCLYVPLDSAGIAGGRLEAGGGSWFAIRPTFDTLQPGEEVMLTLPRSDGEAFSEWYF